MFSGWINKRATAAIVAGCMVIGAAQATAASADTLTTLPPDRVDRMGTEAAYTGYPFTPPPDAGGRTAPAQPVKYAVTLPPDRQDGLGSAQLPTMPAPVVLVKAAPVGFDWLAAVSGAAAALALVLMAAAVRLARSHRVAAHRM